jgi:hypothetical protein
MKSVSKKDIILAHALKPENWRPSWSKISKVTGIPISTVYSSLQFEKFDIKVKHIKRQPPLRCMNPGCNKKVKVEGWCSVECAATFGRGDGQ